MISDSENYISITEEGNAVDSLEKIHYFLSLVKKYPVNWKWVVLALFDALYGFAICALKGVALYSESENCNAIYMRKGKLITLHAALRKCRNPKIMVGYEGIRPLCYKGTQQQSILKLNNELRNKFAHFVPQTWFISTDDLSKVVTDTLDVIRFLAIDTVANVQVLAERESIEKLIDDCKILARENSATQAP